MDSSSLVLAATSSFESANEGSSAIDSFSSDCFSLEDDSGLFAEGDDTPLSLVRLGRRFRFRVAASFFVVVAADKASINISDSSRMEAENEIHLKYN